MPIKWKKKKNAPLKPDVILEKLESIKTVNKDGSVSFEAYECSDAKTALYTMVNFNSDISSNTKKGILWAAISKVAKVEKLTSDAVLRELNSEVSKFKALREKEFSLLTSISISPQYRPIKSIIIQNCKIRFLAGSFPKKYQSRKTAAKQWHLKEEHTPNEYCKIIISTKAKLTHEAVHQCIEALDMLRAIMCLISSDDVLFAGSSRKPVNNVMLGGLHSIHLASGKLAEKFYWYEPGYQIINAHQFKNRKAQEYEQDIKWILNQLSKTPYRAKLKDAFLRYVRAFDEGDKNTIILKGWNVMESLLSSGGNCDLVSKRCSFLFDESDYHRQIIEHLREYRNTSVHAGEFLDDATRHCYQLQRYIIQTLLFYLNKAEKFLSLDEANTFLDLPSNNVELENRKALIEEAIEYRT